MLAPNRTHSYALQEFAETEARARRMRDEAVQAAETRYQADCENARRIEQRKIRMSEIALRQPLKDLLVSHVAHQFSRKPGPFYSFKAILTQPQGIATVQFNPEYEAHLASIDLVAALQNLAEVLSEETATPLMRLGSHTAIELPTAPKEAHQVFSADIFHDLPECKDAPFEITALRAIVDIFSGKAFFNLAIYAYSKTGVDIE
jgi:hypothetical protein